MNVLLLSFHMILGQLLLVRVPYSRTASSTAARGTPAPGPAVASVSTFGQPVRVCTADLALVEAALVVLRALNI